MKKNVLLVLGIALVGCGGEQEQTEVAQAPVLLSGMHHFTGVADDARNFYEMITDAQFHTLKPGLSTVWGRAGVNVNINVPGSNADWTLTTNRSGGSDDTLDCTLEMTPVPGLIAIAPPLGIRGPVSSGASGWFPDPFPYDSNLKLNQPTNPAKNTTVATLSGGGTNRCHYDSDPIFVFPLAGAIIVSPRIGVFADPPMYLVMWFRTLNGVNYFEYHTLTRT